MRPEPCNALRNLSLAVLCAALFSPLAPAQPAVQRAPTVAEQYLLAMANRERSQRGIQPLVWDGHLAAAALQHAQRMAQEGSISHKFPGEPDMQSRAAAASARFSRIAENVAMASTPQILHAAWMNSPGHRANLLEPHENAVGIAVVASSGQLFAVEDFSEQVASTGLSGQEAQVAAQLRAAGIADVQATDDARKSCVTAAGPAGSRQVLFVMRYATSDLSLLPDALKARLADKRMHHAEVGACTPKSQDFSSFSIVVLLYP